ncbi:MAG: class I SAM-dependent methyltransferase [Phycisphaeraceae bacterium]|nr:class I SAM-dependent methyltransferase [Phycisphaeraceae bacterium]
MKVQTPTTSTHAAAPGSGSAPGSPTRGRGLLEGFLARKRAAAAMRLIGDYPHDAAVLDIGCGSQPWFLAHSHFAEKFGLDQLATDPPPELVTRDGISLRYYDIHSDEPLPFEDQRFHVVTLLAVFEHIREDRLAPLLDEVARVLRPGGLFVMTTPARWAGPVLRVMKITGLVSRQEIDEHVREYTPAAIRQVLARSRMSHWPTQLGFFECFLNIHVRVQRPNVHDR